MFVSTNLTAGFEQPSMPQKTVKSAVQRANEMPLPDKVCFVLNAVISLHGQMTIKINMRGKKFITPYSTSTTTPFTGETAFESGTGMWVFNVCGLLCYPQDTLKFVKWIEESFALLNQEPAGNPGQPIMEFSRVS